MNRNHIFCILQLCLLPWIVAAQDWEWDPADYPPMYYKETPFGYEKLDSLPVITVHDTVYIADIDAFLKSYIADGADINALTRDVNGLRALLDSMSGMTDERLYYNFFLRADSLDRMSDGFVVRELEIDEGLVARAQTVREPSAARDSTVCREILLRIDGAERTTRFIRDRSAIRKAISFMFTEMSADSARIRGIDIYLPDYDFTYRREMVQFIKSVRIMMDASRDFKFGDTSLDIFFNDDELPDAPDFIYALGQEASSVVFLDTSVPGDFYLRAKRITPEDMADVGLFNKLGSHFLIARYYTGDLDIRNGQMTAFAEADIRAILEADYPENEWESFMYILIAIVLMMVVLVLLYRHNAAVSLFVSHHAESVLLVLIVMVLEMGILFVTAFQNMCRLDSFTIIERHPVVIFLLPLVVVLAAPLLHYVLKNRKTP